MLSDPDYGAFDHQRIGGYRTTMGAPMLLDDEVVGALLLWRNEVNAFDDREMAIVTAFAGQAAMAVNGVKLVQELETRGTELAKRVDELEALREVGEAVNSSLDVDRVLSTIAMHAVELSGTDGGSIMEYSERDRCFRVTQRLPHPARGGGAAARRSGSTSTRPWSAAPPGSAVRSRSPTCARSTSIRIYGSSTTPDGGRWSPYRCCARTRSSGP